MQALSHGSRPKIFGDRRQSDNRIHEKFCCLRAFQSALNGAVMFLISQVRASVTNAMRIFI